MQRAIDDDDIRKLSEVLEADPSALNCKLASGRTPLHKACFHGKILVVPKLLDRGADVNIPDIFGDTPLHTVCRKGFTNYLPMLLKTSCASINISNSYGKTPFDIACLKGYIHMAIILLEHGAKLYADNSGNIRENCLDITRLKIDFLRSLFDHSPHLVNMADINGKTPLHIACYVGNEKLCRLLLDKGGKHDNLDNDGLYPIHEACKKEFVEIINVLLQAQPDSVNWRDGKRRSPLHIACSVSNHNEMVGADMVQLLLNNGACISSTDNDGRTAIEMIRNSSSATCNLLVSAMISNASSLRNAEMLYLSVVNRGLFENLLHEATLQRKNILNIACAYFSAKAIDIILDKAVCLLNTSDANGLYPIHVATARGNVEILQTLIARGADVSQPTDVKKNTALQIALYNNRSRCALILLSPTGVFQNTDMYGNTPLHLALKDTGNSDLVTKVRHLISWDPRQLHVRNGSGFLTLHLAVMSNNVELVKLVMLYSNVNSVTNNGHTALHIACHFQNEEAVSALLAHPGLHVNAKTHTGDTAAHITSRKRNKRIMKALQQHPLFSAKCRNAEGSLSSEIWSPYGDLNDLDRPLSGVDYFNYQIAACCEELVYWKVNFLR